MKFFNAFGLTKAMCIELIWRCSIWAAASVKCLCYLSPQKMHIENHVKQNVLHPSRWQPMKFTKMTTNTHRDGDPKRSAYFERTKIKWNKNIKWFILYLFIAYESLWAHRFFLSLCIWFRFASIHLLLSFIYFYFYLTWFYFLFLFFKYYYVLYRYS